MRAALRGVIGMSEVDVSASMIDPSIRPPASVPSVPETLLTAEPAKL
jgi:hypothetical protein